MQDDRQISLKELATYWDDREIGGKLGPYGLVHWYTLGRFGHSLALNIAQNLLNADYKERDQTLNTICISLQDAGDLIKNDPELKNDLVRSTKTVLQAERIYWDSVEEQVDLRLKQLLSYLDEIEASISQWRKTHSSNRNIGSSSNYAAQVDLYGIISRLIWNYHFIHSDKLHYGSNSVLLTWLPEIQLLSKAYEAPGRRGNDFQYIIYPSVKSVVEQGATNKLYELLAASLKLGSVAHSQTPCLGYVKVAEKGSSGFRQIIDKGGFIAGADKLGNKEYEGTGSSEWSDLFYFNRSALKLNLTEQDKSFSGRLYVCSVLDSESLSSLLSWLLKRGDEPHQERLIFGAVEDLWDHAGPDATSYLRDSIGNLVRFHHQINEQSKSFAEAAVFQEIKNEIDGLIEIDQKTHILLQRIEEKLRRVSRGFLRYYDEIRELFRDNSTFQYRIDENNYVLIGGAHSGSVKIETAHGPMSLAPPIWIDYSIFLHAFGKSRHNKFLETLPIAISLISLKQKGSWTESGEMDFSSLPQSQWKEFLDERRNNTEWNQRTLVQGFWLLKWALQKSHDKTEMLHPYQLAAAILARMSDEKKPLQPNKRVEYNIILDMDYVTSDPREKVFFKQGYSSSSFFGLVESLFKQNIKPLTDDVHDSIRKINAGKIPLGKIPSGIRAADVMDALMRLLRVELAHNEPDLVELGMVEIKYICHMNDAGKDSNACCLLEVRLFCAGMFGDEALSKLQNLNEDAGNHGLRSCFDILCRSANQLMPELIYSYAQANDRGVWILRNNQSEEDGRHAYGDQILIRWPLMMNDINK